MPKKGEDVKIQIVKANGSKSVFQLLVCLAVCVVTVQPRMVLRVSGRRSVVWGWLLLVSCFLLHIMEHLEGVIDKPESDMLPQELQLHYFKMHDYDGNNLLDGLELATAITHVHKEERGEESQPMKEEDLISLIDDVLRDDDKNNDGYIDYAEFAKSLE
ncbi:unnamed protein product [Coregonus sp. 'balchen']|nr:unnamed protein product [Coregonus sp. 'balchen']